MARDDWRLDEGSDVTGRLGLLLAPGAGAGRDHPQLTAVDRAATAEGAAVARMDFPYRKAGRRSPDRPAVLMDAVLREAEQLAGECETVVLGGRSMGGRICSMVVAAGFPAAGLVLISYPLHPPGRPERERSDHFPGVRVPCLFVSGTRDPFGTPEELEKATAAIKGVVTHRFLEGKDHALSGCDGAVAGAVTEWLASAGLRD